MEHEGERGKYEVTHDSLSGETRLLAVPNDRLTGRQAGMSLNYAERRGTRPPIVPIERSETEGRIKREGEEKGSTTGSFERAKPPRLNRSQSSRRRR